MSEEPLLASATIDLTGSDVMDATFRASRRMRWVLCLLVTGAMALLLSWGSKSEPTYVPIVLALFAFVFVYTLGGALVMAVSWLRFRQLPQDRRVARWDFFQNRIQLSGANFGSTAEWSYWRRVLTTRRLFILVHPTSAIQVLPLRCFSDPAQVSVVADCMVSAGLLSPARAAAAIARVRRPG